jgi:hypothetical protein
MLFDLNFTIPDHLPYLLYLPMDRDIFLEKILTG